MTPGARPAGLLAALAVAALVAATVFGPAAAQDGPAAAQDGPAAGSAAAGAGMQAGAGAPPAAAPPTAASAPAGSVAAASGAPVSGASASAPGASASGPSDPGSGAAAVVEARLPVRIYPRIMAFNGNPGRAILRTPEARYTLVSAHKEAGRPWADAVMTRETRAGRILLSRAYDCAAATFRWLGEGPSYRAMTASVRPEQTGDRRLRPGTVEFELARYVCAL